MLAKNPNYDWAAIERRAEQIAAEIQAKQGKFYAEIPEGTTASWHIVRTLPGKEDKALQYLSDRGIGAFLPRFQRGSVVRGKHGADLGGGNRRLIFPGLLFVFVWDVELHWRRIHACPGVQRVVLDGGGKPVVVPDHDVDRIMALQYAFMPGAPKSRKRKRYSAEPAAVDPFEFVRVSTWSAFADIGTLDS